MNEKFDSEESTENKSLKKLSLEWKLKFAFFFFFSITPFEKNK